MKRIVRLYQSLQSVDEEIFKEFVQVLSVLHRENVINQKSLLDATRTFLSSGSCYGLSAIVKNSLKIKDLTFK